MGIMVDRGKFKWDDRVVDLYPEFQLKDPWVTREFRVFDLLAQRSGLPPYANDTLGMIGLDEAAMIRSLRYVEPVSSFRTTFAYTNITHTARRPHRRECRGRPGLERRSFGQELLDPLGMKDSSYTAEAIDAAANHAERLPLDAERHDRGAVHADLPLSTSAAPATSTPTSRTWRAGSGCSSATAPSKGGASSRRKASPPRARRRWR